jgi:hypothetical protein
MRARGLRGTALLLIAGAGFGFVIAGAGLGFLISGAGLGLAAGFAQPEGAAVEPQASDAGGSGRREAMPKPRAKRPAERGQRGDPQRDEWWVHAREVLFRDLELSAEQARGVDAIIERQLAARKRARELETELQAARRQGDAERTATLRAELRANRAQIKGPHARIEEMRALLSEEQRPTFDINRARLVAEGQQSRKPRQEQRARRPGAGGEMDTE